MLRISPRLQGLLPVTLLDSVFVFQYARFRTNLFHATNRRIFLPILWQPRNTGRRFVSHDTQQLTSLRLAFAENHLEEIRRICREMSINQTLDVITGRDWMYVSLMFANYINQYPLSQSDEHDKEIAIHCATHGFTNPLKAYMSLHFQAGEYDNVIALYDRYFVEYERVENERVKTLITRESPDYTPKLNSIPKYLVPLDNNLQMKHTPPGATELLIFMVAAHAAKDDLDGAFERYMDSPMIVQVKNPSVKAFCDVHLTHKPDLAHTVQEWIQELDLCRLVSRKSSFDTYLTNLARDGNVVALQKLYERVIGHCDDPSKILCIIQNSQEGSGEPKRLAVPEDAWGSFFRAFLKCNRHDLVGQLWANLRSRGLIPNLHVRNVLLQGFNRHGYLDKAQAVWKDMLNAGIEPNDISYGAMIQAYFRNRKPKEALAMFNQFQKLIRVNPKGEETLHESNLLPLYNIVLHGLLTRDSFSKAESMLQYLQEHGPKPDVITYNIFLRFYGRIGDLKALGDTLQKMKELGVDADVYSFVTILSALYRIGRHDAHTQLLNIMKSVGLQPNVAMYSAIVNFLVREGGQENIRNAILLLHHMENDSDRASRPNEITYTALLAGIHRDPSLTTDEVNLYKEDLFGRMRRNGILPNRTTYHFLIKACLENPDARGLQEGLRYYGEMEKRGIAFTNRTWHVLLSSLMQRQDVGTAGKIVNDMYRKGHQPDESLRILVSKVQEAMSRQRI